MIIHFVYFLAKVEAGEDPSATLGNREESDENDMAEMLEDLFASVMTLMDTTDPERPLHLMFRLLPSQKRYIFGAKIKKKCLKKLTLILGTRNITKSLLSPLT